MSLLLCRKCNLLYNPKDMTPTHHGDTCPSCGALADQFSIEVKQPLCPHCTDKDKSIAELKDDLIEESECSKHRLTRISELESRLQEAHKHMLTMVSNEEMTKLLDIAKGNTGLIHRIYEYPVYAQQLEFINLIKERLET